MYMFFIPLIPPLVAAIVAQLMKVIIAIARGQFSWHVLRRYGGMPSSHSALVVGLVAQAIITDGWTGMATAIALALAVLIIRDATGFRRTCGQYAAAVNRLVAQLPAKQQTDFTYLDEVVGHTPLEVVVGGIVGLLVVLGWSWL